jgi:hypothetical protein
VDHAHRALVLHVQADLVHRVLVLHVQVDHAQLEAQDSARHVQAASALLRQLLVDVQALEVAVVAVLGPLVRLVRVAARARPESQSAPREKSLSKDRLRAWVVQLFQEATAAPLFVFAAEHRFRTSLTRLVLTPVS